MSAFQLAPASAASAFVSCSRAHALELLKNGVRTGDQLLKVGGQNVAGMSLDAVLRLLRKRLVLSCFRFLVVQSCKSVDTALFSMDMVSFAINVQLCSYRSDLRTLDPYGKISSLTFQRQPPVNGRGVGKANAHRKHPR